VTAGRRITEERPDDLGASLLRAARRDRAPADVDARASLLVDAVMGGLPLPPPAGHAPTSTAPAAAHGVAKLAALKWIATFGVAALAVGVVATRRPPANPAADPPAHAGTSIVSIESTAPGASAPTPPAPLGVAPTADGTVEATSSTPRPVVAPPARGKAPGAKAPLARAPGEATSAIDSDSLAAEVQSLDVARRALASGDAATALALLDVHDRRFAQQALGPEAQALRIRALARGGDRAAAVAAYRAFAARNPKSPVRVGLAKELGIDAE
jgi:hypothetical protein